MDKNMNNKLGNLDFITDGAYTKDDIKRVQKISIELLSKIATILDKYDIKYVVCYGTLLGLVRHEGNFIPWDDDCDLFIFEDQYARAIEILRRELPNDMIVHNKRTDPIYWVTWTKIRDSHSYTEESLWENDRKLRFHGVFIDLFVANLSTMGEYKKLVFERNLQKRKKRITKKKKSKKRISILKRIKWGIGNLYYKFIHILYKMFYKLNKTKIVIVNKNTIIETVFKEKDILPLKRCVFEGVNVYAPNNPDKTLKTFYGDYMKLPPLEKRLPHFSKVEFFD